MSIRFPERSRNKSSVLKSLSASRKNDVRWKEGRAFSLVFYPGEEIYALVREAFFEYFSENGLNPSAFPSLRKFETEVVAMVADLLHGNAPPPKQASRRRPDGYPGTAPVTGNMTSGGTESILLAVYTAREWARRHRPAVSLPQMILPVSAHPAFDKAAHYFNIAIKRVPVRADFRADVDAVRTAVNKNTILIVGSAPQYPQGVVDPIAEMADIAQEHGILFHTDACVGGMMLPFVRELGYAVPDFDFSVPGVTSMSVDIHKYGYAAKGASVVLYRNATLRRHQFFVHTDWTGGIYGSPGVLGTRMGGSIAAAWAVLQFLGREGYLRLNREVMDTVQKIQSEVEKIPGLRVLGQPEGSVLALAPTENSGLDIYQAGDELQVRGWHLDKQQNPACLHLTVSHAHVASVDDFLRDLRECARLASGWSPHRMQAAFQEVAVRALARVLPAAWLRALSNLAGGAPSGRSAAMYGMIGALPAGDDLQEIVLGFMDKLYRVE